MKTAKRTFSRISSSHRLRSTSLRLLRRNRSVSIEPKLNENCTARVVASDLDERAVACARANGVEAYEGDLFAPMPRSLEGHVDVVVGAVPYVPTHDLALLQRDTLTFESPLSYDGGPDGTDILRRVIAESPRYLRHGGALLLELGAGQPEALADQLSGLRYAEVHVLRDDEGDIRGIEATYTAV